MISITKQRERIKAKMAKLSADLLELQSVCPHSSATRTAKSDTGNWDRGQDSYWYEFTCPECGKYWTEPQ